LVNPLGSSLIYRFDLLVRGRVASILPSDANDFFASGRVALDTLSYMFIVGMVLLSANRT
jgi:hypothetical protein